MARSTRNVYLLLFIAIFIIMSLILYSSIDSPSSMRRADKNAEVLRLQQKMSSLEENLRRNGEEMDRLRKELRESERLRKELEKKEIGEIFAQVPEPRGGGNKAEVVRRFLSKTTKPARDVCPMRKEMSVPNSEIQMFDMYNLIDFANTDGGVWKQGWEVKYDAEAVKTEPQLEVIVVPHSHCDPGWLRTFEEYFDAQTKLILDGMATHLPQQDQMSFIYAEVSFFELWWRGLDEPTREKVKGLLSSGRLELVTGGWVMADEANTHYNAIIAELMEGHEWIKNHLPKEALPRVHWSIDPFGISPTVPYIMSAANITRAAIQRVHYSVKKELAKQRNLEFVWRQMWDSSKATDVRTHMFPFYSYDIPHTCGPDPKVCCQFDFRRLSGGGFAGCPWGIAPQLINEDNVATRAALIYDQYRKKAQLYKTNAVLIPLGDDFRYDTTFEWKQQYENFQKLFAYMNGQKEWNVKARFGTLSDYFSVLEKHTVEQKIDLPVLSGDFFTYADRDDHYWSGYFTSRPFYKQLDRVLQHYLRSAEIVFSLSHMSGGDSGPASEESFERLVRARRALALFQHHDGVTGTGKDHVVKDYGQKMLDALRDCEEVITVATEVLLQKKGSAAGQLQLDESRSAHDALPERRAAEVGSSLILFNALSTVRHEVACVRVADAKARLCFDTSIAPLSLQTYSVVSEASSTDDGERATVAGTARVESNDFKSASLPSGNVVLKNDRITAEFDAGTGMLESVTPVGASTATKTHMKFVKYGARGHKRMNNGGGDDLSGAYLFLPDGDAKDVPSGDSHYVVVQGPLVSRVYVQGPQEFRLLTTYSLDAGAPYVEITNEIDITERMQNVEVAMKIESSVDSADSIYTDLNGMQMIRRRRQLDRLPLQAHYYPMPGAAFVESAEERLSLMGAQALGVASLKPGELEVMLERRLLQDDGRGLQQGVMDNLRTVSHFRLMVERMGGERSAEDERMGFLSLPATSASRSLHYPWVKILSEDSDLSPSFIGLQAPLPCDTHIVTLRTIAEPTKYGSARPTTAPSSSAALVLYRPLVDCRSTTPAADECADSKGEDSFSVLFGAGLKSASTATLTMLYESKGTTERLAVEPQQLMAYKLRF
ncbi:aman-2 [Pristionchus pacificus]|uniref:mannosyl-oligosaccharide 1,3-1,6-alpha-mannosidase n=1 Tax=Pristionchus pacificus TaxID=54126 RepID=A0A2A6BRC8_PRIPA|nr:aman-2 [Pristionchus pacificus]|eukprot:PDM68418.1 aman-2 [Pristionchus pacificus]